MDYDALGVDQFDALLEDDFDLLLEEDESSSSSASSLSSSSSASSASSNSSSSWSSLSTPSSASSGSSLSSSSSSSSTNSLSSNGHSESSSSSSSGLLVLAGTIPADIYLAIATFYADAYEAQVAIINLLYAAVERLRCQNEVQVTMELLEQIAVAAKLGSARLQATDSFLPAVRSIQQHVRATSGLSVAEWIAEAVDGGKVPYAWALLSKQVGFDIDNVIDWTTESSSSPSST